MDFIDTFKFSVKEALILLNFSQEQQEHYVNELLRHVLTKTFIDKASKLSPDQKEAFRKRLSAESPEDFMKIISDTFEINKYKNDMKKNLAQMYDNFIETVSRKATDDQRVILQKMHKVFKSYF